MKIAPLSGVNLSKDSPERAFVLVATKTGTRQSRMQKRILSFCSVTTGETLHRILRQNGHSILWVLDVEEATAFLRTGDFDLVILESNLDSHIRKEIEAVANGRNIPVRLLGSSAAVPGINATSSSSCEQDLKALFSLLKPEQDPS